MIDVTHQINQVRRQVGTRTLETGEARVVTISQTYATSLDDIWDACTNPVRIPRWFLPISGNLQVDGRYQLEGNANGTILSCDPPNSFTATWEMRGDTSWIEVSFSEETDGRVRMELDHIAHIDDDLWEQFGPGAAGLGWDLALTALVQHLASGETVDPAAAAEWMGSDEGYQFMSRSNDQWCQASIDFGTPEEEARAAAERTLAFYTES